LTNQRLREKRRREVESVIEREARLASQRAWGMKRREEESEEERKIRLEAQRKRESERRLKMKKGASLYHANSTAEVYVTEIAENSQ
jgi:RNA-splicing ligase RtcB